MAIRSWVPDIFEGGALILMARKNNRDSSKSTFSSFRPDIKRAYALWAKINYLQFTGIITIHHFRSEYL